VIKGMFWRPTKKEILEWLDMKEREFEKKENRNPRMSKKKWMHRYVYIELHEILFGEFPIILMKWLETLVENSKMYRDIMPRNWTPNLVRQLNYVSNNAYRTIDLWFHIILGGYITEFAVDCTQSYNVIERDFFKGS
jgi:hypothetical protein